MPATLHFYLREDRPDKRGYCSIFLRITHSRKHKYLNTGIKITPADWNPTKQQVRKTHRTYNKLNDELDIIRAKAEEAYRELNHERRASAGGIKKKLEYYSRDNFFDLAADYLAELKPESFHNWKQSRVAIEKLRDFHGAAYLPVNAIDRDFLNKFVRYLSLKRGNMASTVEKNFNPIRNILSIAAERELIAFNPEKEVGFSLPKKNGGIAKAKISQTDIKAIENLQLNEGNPIFDARNAFMLAYYFCGIRFGDLAALKWENVKNGRLKYRMSKTGHIIDVKMPEGAKRYLNYYGSTEKNDTAYILPFLSGLTPEQEQSAAFVRQRIGSANAMVNGQRAGGKLSGLKAIAQMAGVDENLSMHVARHSFAQYAIEEKNVPVYRLMILLGHQNIKTTMQYLKTISIKAADETIETIF